MAGTGFIGPCGRFASQRYPSIGYPRKHKRKSEQKVAELGIPRVYDSLDEMLAKPDINVVHPATPNHLHHLQAKAA